MAGYDGIDGEMKRILIFAVCLFLLTMSAFAHGGSTDEDGGHTDRSTGDYHYHHGYPAHDHEDLDGDGDLDCPYDFDDQTDHGSNNGEHRKDSSNNDGSKFSATEFTETKDEKPSTPKWKIMIIVILIVGIIVCCLIISHLTKSEKEAIAKMEQAEKKADKAKFDICVQLCKQLGTDYKLKIAGAPSGVYIGSDKLPHSYDRTTGTKWGYNCTYIVSKSSYSRSAGTFHRMGCRYIKCWSEMQEVHFTDVVGRHTMCPCKVCNEHNKDLQWQEEYVKVVALLYYDDKQL